MDDTFDLATLEAQDEITCAIKHPRTGEPTTWVWTLYGPGHPKTIELAERVSREALREQNDQLQARVNGKKWKPEEQTIDQIRARNAASIAARTKSFTPVKLGSETIEFNPEAAVQLLLDRKKNFVFNQLVEFLQEDANFIRPSA